MDDPRLTTPKLVKDRLVRIESKLSRFIENDTERQRLVDLRLDHIETQLDTLVRNLDEKAPR